MKTSKRLALGLFIAAISSSVFADIIELDSLNPDHCRQQILRTTDGLPVIATYNMRDYPDSESFMEKFELLAKDHPEKTFFKWDAQKDVQHVTQTLCLQQLGFLIQPNMILLAVAEEAGTGEKIMSSPLRLSWAGEMTLAEMNKFIDVSDSSLKKSALLHTHHHYSK